MNARSYRLVFSKRLGMHVPVSEASRSHAGKRRNRGAKARLAAALLTMLAAPAWALDSTALPTGAEVRHGTIGIAQTGNTLNINQSTQSGIIHWNSFNIGSAATVNFNQPNATAATLNRITGNEASVIQGAMNATGAVYVINRNGILFDKGAQVNLHSLVASTLDIQDDDLFLNGFLTQAVNSPAFSEAYTGFTGDAPPGMVRVAEGARIAATSNGRIILLAPDVENKGIVESPGGQVILAAGHKAYFRIADGSDKSLLRGLTVEVESGGSAVNLGQLAADDGGDVTLIGKLVKQNGLVTASTTVNLNGSIHLLARYIDPNKSIALESGGRPLPNATGEVQIGAGSSTSVMPALDANKVRAAMAAGKLTQAQVDAYRAGRAKAEDFYAYMPDTTLQDTQAFNKSVISVEGKKIHVEDGAMLAARSGDVTMRAHNGGVSYVEDGESPGSFVQNESCPDCRLQIDDGATIDVSGLRDVEVAMERNVVTVELRGDELKDSPLLRGLNNPNYGADTEEGNNPLYAQKIKVDLRETMETDIYGEKVTRQGTPLADASGYIAQIGRKIDEKSTSGGTVHLYSEGELVVQRGAKVDLSGGSVAYQDGWVTTSQLIYKGRLVGIAEAEADRLYSGLGADKVLFEKGYIEGKDAGSLEVVAPWMTLQGTLAGSTVAGIHQRGQSGDALPKGAALTLGVNHTAGSVTRDHRLLGAVSFSDTTQGEAPAWGEAMSDELKRTIVLDPGMLTASNVTRLAVYTNNAISLAAGQSLNVGIGGSVNLNGGALDIAGQILAPGGEVALNARLTDLTQAFAENNLGWDYQSLGLDQHLNLGSNSKIVTAGLWTNDYLARNTRSPVALDGGGISLYSEGEMRLEQGSLLDASAGAWLMTDGKTWKTGQGGDIALEVGGDLSQEMDAKSLFLGGELRSYGILDSSLKAGKGGSLSLSLMTGARIGGIAPESGEYDGVWLSESFFSRGGFTGYDISTAGALDIAPNARIEPRAWVRVLASKRLTTATGADIESFAKPGFLQWNAQKAQRPSVDLSLASLTDLTVGVGASINADALAKVALEAAHRLEVNGSISAPGGKLELTLNLPSGKLYESGYLAGSAIWLGEQATLSVAGAARTWQTGNGLVAGEVLPGGAIVLTSHAGSIVAMPGSVMDVSGSSAALDLPQVVDGGVRYARTGLYSEAGSVSLAAAEGIWMGGQFKTRQDNGSPLTGRGSLTVQIDRAETGEVVTNPYPDGKRKIELYDSLPVFPADPLSAEYNGIAVLAASQLENFDDVSLKGRDQIVFKDSLDLSLRGSLILDTPEFVFGNGVSATLKANYVNLGNQDPLHQTAGTYVPAPTAGNGTLTVEGDLVDLMGRFAVSGAASTLLTSDGDLRLVGVIPNDGSGSLMPTGQMTTAGDLTLTASQVYPTTLSSYTLESSKAGGKIAIVGSGGIPDVPLAGAGEVTIRADVIQQAGVLRAPLGRIVLDAGKQLILDDGSLTSVSAEGKYIPFGRVENGLSWVYDVNVGGQAKTITVFSGADGIVNLPEKNIVLSGVAIDQKASARVDLSGGGDLVGYEFTPGPGGSRDYLADEGVYAIIPGVAAAPFDFQNSAYSYESADLSTHELGSGASQRVSPGQSVYLSGVPGLAAGYYTLLPARYAQLPGAYTVRAVANTGDMVSSQNIRQADGSYLVAGYQANLGSTETGAVRWSGFEVASREMVTSREGFSFQYSAAELAAQKNTGRSELADYRAGQLIAAVATNYDLNLPKFAQDAGRLSIKAKDSIKTGDVVDLASSLILDGSINFEKQTGALGGELDISAPKIAVTSGDAPDGYLVLDVARLNAFGVDSLMLGGIRESMDDAGSVYVSQGASDILVDTGSEALIGSEIMLVATNSIAVSDGSEIRGEGLGTAGSETLVFGQDGVVDGDGALLRVSSGGLRGVVRRQVARDQGDIEIGDGAIVAGDGSVTLDVTHDMDNRGSVELADGAALHLGAARISIGQIDAVEEGMVVSDALLEGLGAPSQIVLKSYSSIDVYGDASLGDADTQRLALQAAAIVGKETGNFDITATVVSFANPDARSSADAVEVGAGNLNVTAENIEFGLGVVKTQGFGQINLDAQDEIAAVEAGNGMTSGMNVSDGDFTLTSQRLTGHKGSKANFTASGKLATKAAVAAAGSSLPTLGAVPYGAVLNLAGASVEHGGSIEMPYGWLTMTAETGDLKLLTGSKIFTGGLVRTFKGVNDTVDVYVPGGLTTLKSSHGDVIVGSGARVDVGGTGGADAGSLAISATEGKFSLQGELVGNAVAATQKTSPWKGAFSLDAKVLDDGDAATTNDFSSLLDHMTGFGATFNLRLRGDAADLDNPANNLTIAAADTITAERVVLSVDNGVLDIHGDIDARATEGGWVLAAAGKELYLRDGAEIDASATGANQPGGEVYLISGANADYAALSDNNGALVLEDGSDIKVGGTLAYQEKDINSVVKGTGTNSSGQAYYDLRDGDENTYLDFTEETPVYYFKASETNAGASTIRVRALDHSTAGYPLMQADGVTPVAESEIQAGDKVTVELRLGSDGTSWVFVLVSKTASNSEYSTSSNIASDGKTYYKGLTPSQLGLGADPASKYWVYDMAMTQGQAIALDPAAGTTFTFTADTANDRGGADGSNAFLGVRLRLWEKSAAKDIALVHNDDTGSVLRTGEIQQDQIVKVAYSQSLGKFVIVPESGGQVHLQAPRMVGEAQGALYQAINAVAFANNTYKVTYPGATTQTTSLQAGTVVSFVAPAGNTGNVRITLANAGSALANKALLTTGGAQVAAGGIEADGTVYAVWDGSNFRMVDSSFGSHEVSTPSAGTYAVVTAGSTDRYTVQDVAQPKAGDTLVFTVSQANTNKNVKINLGSKDYSLTNAAGTAIGAGSLKAGDVVYAFYDGVRFRLAAEANVPLDAGSANKYKVTVADAGQVTAGFTVAFQAKTKNTGSSTLDILDASGNVLVSAATLLDGGTELANGSINAKDFVYAYYDGSRFHLMREVQAKHAVGEDVKITDQFGSYGAGGIGATIAGASRIEAVANQVTNATSDTVDFSGIYADSLRYMAEQGTATLARLASPGNASVLHLRPGAEVRRGNGDLVVNGDVDLSGYRFGGEPGVLTLRSAGQLRFSGSLSDGFSDATTAGTLSGGDSWSYLLTAGADLGAANPLAYVKGTGDLVLDGGKLIRTGTGAIQIAAGGDVKIGRSVANNKVTYDTASVIYTAGRASVLEAEFRRPDDDKFDNVVYPEAGGALGIEAGGSIYAPAADQVMNKWLVRRGEMDGEGNILATLTWGIDFNYFNQGVGALGGGNVRIVAGENIDNLSVSLPTVARDLSSDGEVGSELVETGGGRLEVQASGDILGGIFYVQRGQGRVLSGGEIGAVTGAADGWSEASKYGRNLLLATGEAPLQVYARRDLAVESVFNPTVVPMSGAVSKDSQGSLSNSYFFTYGANSSVDLVSVQGNVLLNNKSANVFNSSKQPGLVLTGSTDGYFVYPGSVRVAALNGDIEVANSFALYPSQTGQLHMLASGDVVFNGGVNMSDADVAKLPSLANPATSFKGATGKNLLLNVDSASTDPDLHAATPVHQAINAGGSAWYDPDPVRVYAENGSISSKRNSSTGGQRLSFPKSVEFLAGRDIVDVSLTAQNLNAEQTSYIWAARDVRFAPNRSTDSGKLKDNGRGIRISGPGNLEIVTGRNLDLGNTEGIIATGNTANSALPVGSADILLLVGMGSDGDGRPRLPDYQALLDGDAENGGVSLATLENQFLDYERVRLALLQPANTGLSYKEVLDRLEDPDYRAQMTALALAERDASLAAYLNMPDKVRAERLFFSELQAASSQASLMKQLISMGFGLDELKLLGQQGVAAGYLATLASVGLPASSLEKFERFFTDVASLIAYRGVDQSNYDVLGDLGYSRADKAIARMFPSVDGDGSKIAYKGDFSGFFSQIRTEQASDINLLIPGGSATVGLVSKPSDLERADSTLGMFTVNGGSIRSYTQGDFKVNTSRVFTLGWEETLERTAAQRLVRDDLVLYSKDGDIDAGKGAKTSSSAPPPRYRYDSVGNLTVDLSSTISGAGIGVLLARDVIVPGDAYLIAPNGEIDAGDAGIRASGNIFVDANRVVGADNIVSVGLSVGVPAAVDTSGLSVSGIGNVGDAAKAASDATASIASSSEDAQETAQKVKQAMANFRPSFITVEVLGFGDGTASVSEQLDETEKKRREDEQRRRSGSQGA